MIQETLRKVGLRWLALLGTASVSEHHPHSHIAVMSARARGGKSHPFGIVLVVGCEKGPGSTKEFCNNIKR